MLELDHIITVFDDVFGEPYNVCLIGGADEPIYLPASKKQVKNRLYFTQDYLASALHEIAHWCVASVERLEQKDWGYWYVPDGRNKQQQAAFQKVESNNQAVEWFLSLACGHAFQVSVDNLTLHSSSMSDSKEVEQSNKNFKDQLHQKALFYCEQGLPERAEQFCQVAMLENGKPIQWTSDYFLREDLD